MGGHFPNPQSCCFSHCPPLAWPLRSSLAGPLRGRCALGGWRLGLCSVGARFAAGLDVQSPAPRRLAPQSWPPFWPPGGSAGRASGHSLESTTCASGPCQGKQGTKCLSRCLPQAGHCFSTRGSAVVWVASSSYMADLMPRPPFAVFSGLLITQLNKETCHHLCGHRAVLSCAPPCCGGPHLSLEAMVESSIPPYSAPTPNTPPPCSPGSRQFPGTHFICERKYIRSVGAHRPPLLVPSCFLTLQPVGSPVRAIARVRHELGFVAGPPQQYHHPHCRTPGPSHSLLLGLRPGSQLCWPGSPASLLPTPFLGNSPLPSSGAESR